MRVLSACVYVDFKNGRVKWVTGVLETVSRSLPNHRIDFHEYILLPTRYEHSLRKRDSRVLRVLTWLR